MTVMVPPSFVISFFGLIFPERDLLFWLGVFLVCVQRFAHTRSLSALWGALFAAQFALYYKEPVFLLIGGFAFIRLLLYGRREPGLLRRGQLLAFLKGHSLEVALLIQSAAFLVLYAVLVLPHIQSSYTDAFVHRGLLGTLVTYVKSDLLLIGFGIVFVWRVGASVVSKRPLDPLWEPLAGGAVLYGLAYVKLELVDAY